ncbi:MAG: sulfate adenylyltransferase subunit CysN [Lentisphaerota bacterium]
MDIDKFLNQHEKKDLLRFLTCGSVDDGKSTLIGRLLFDSKLIYEDQLSTLRRDSEKNGTAGAGEIDYALLLDGLKAEREQGITIDVAYRYFSTPKRKFIIADTPGHEQYTRNMATGASTANLAIILIDTRYGVVTQTKRHAFIISLLGIKHLVVAINKMDLVDYSQEVFNNIRQSFAEFVEHLDIPDVQYIPISALKGENVVEKSTVMPWYQGDSLLEFLETVNVASDRNFTDFRFPVQYVSRPHLDFRGFAGTVASGVVKVGDNIKVLPSLKLSKVKNIVTADGNLLEAFPPQAVTIELEDEIDISSGDMLVHINNQPKVSQRFEAVVIWMTDTPLKPGGNYLIRHAGRNVKSRVDTIIYNIDVNTLQKNKTESMTLNEIGRVVVSTTKPLYFDAYSKNHETGSFVLIDPITNATAGAGMIIEGVSFDSKQDDGVKDTETRLKDHVERREFYWETGLVENKERILRNRHMGKTIVVTGSSNNAVQELATRLEQRLFRLNMNSYYLGISSINNGLDADIRNDVIERDERIRRLGELSRILTDAGLIFITALTDAGDYELNRLKLLNSPNELLIINVDESNFKAVAVDVNLASADSLESNLQSIIKLLSAKNIIPEYCI